MENVIVFVSIAASIVSIVLAIKIWIMTDDIKKIKQHLMIDVDFHQQLRRAYLKGDMSELKKILDNYSIDKLQERIIDGKHFKIENTISMLEENYKKFGFDVPENILKLKDDNADVFCAYNYRD